MIALAPGPGAARRLGALRARRAASTTSSCPRRPRSPRRSWATAPCWREPAGHRPGGRARPARSRSSSRSPSRSPMHFCARAAPRALPAAGRHPGDPDRDDRAAAGRLVRLRHPRPSSSIVALVCFFPDRRHDARRRCAASTPTSTSCCARWAPRAGRPSASPRRPPRCPPRSRGARIAVAIGGIAAVFAEYVGSREGPRPPAAAVDPAARDRARLGRRRRARRARRHLLRPARPRRARAGPLDTGRTAHDDDASPCSPLAALRARRAAARRTTRPTRPEPAARALTLVLDYFPNADHAGIYAAQGTGRVRRRPASTLDIQTPSDPAAPLKLLAAGQRRRRDLLRARAAARARQGPGGRLDRRARAEAADVDHVAGVRQDPQASPTSRARRSATAGHPVPVGLPRDDPRRGRRRPRVASSEINVGFNLTPAMLSKKVDATLGAFWNYEGTELERARRTPTIIRLEQARRADLQRAGARRPRGRRRARVARCCGGLLQALARGHEALRDDPAAGVDPLLAANPDLERGLQEAVVAKTLPRVLPRGRASARTACRTRASGRRYGRWMLENGLIEQATSTRRR